MDPNDETVYIVFKVKYIDKVDQGIQIIHIKSIINQFTPVHLNGPISNRFRIQTLLIKSQSAGLKQPSQTNIHLICQSESEQPWLAYGHILDAHLI